MPVAGGFVHWLVAAAGAGLIGLAIGAALIPLTGYVLAPAWKAMKGVLRKKA